VTLSPICSASFASIDALTRAAKRPVGVERSSSLETTVQIRTLV
jgi:hypothetical protein